MRCWVQEAKRNTRHSALSTSRVACQPAKSLGKQEQLNWLVMAATLPSFKPIAHGIFPRRGPLAEVLSSRHPNAISKCLCRKLGISPAWSPGKGMQPQLAPQSPPAHLLLPSPSAKKHPDSPEPTHLAPIHLKRQARDLPSHTLQQARSRVQVNQPIFPLRLASSSRVGFQGWQGIHLCQELLNLQVYSRNSGEQMPSRAPYSLDHVAEGAKAAHLMPKQHTSCRFTGNKS